ncbi:hypothetical protein MOMA_02865 [Moraxella macacae 0408225]|uniref:DUF11 domain-containing protein n=1 Tax=Moraxella macacae 0408225 TaxID=1230338 RepID=L2F8E2_9GAMM|nr:hypothetical protein [Moraxella macacae]ELA09312.1 hypothetical protein MOMA_02865 [Moraxella macacae 0408225]
MEKLTKTALFSLLTSGMMALGISTQAMAVMPVSGMATTDINLSKTTQPETRILASVLSTDSQGQQVLSPITTQTKLTSGNVIEYHGYIINKSSERIRNVTVTFDIPANTELLSLEDLSPVRAKGSTDGVKFQNMPLKTNTNGVLQNLPIKYYKAVQWDILGLGLNEVATVKYRVRVK